MVRRVTKQFFVFNLLFIDLNIFGMLDDVMMTAAATTEKAGELTRFTAIEVNRMTAKMREGKLSTSTKDTLLCGVD